VDVGKGEVDSGGVNREGEGGGFDCLLFGRVGVGDVVVYGGEEFGVVLLRYWGEWCVLCGHGCCNVAQGGIVGCGWGGLVGVIVCLAFVCCGVGAQFSKGITV
jgi:hypothetical protein